MRKVGDTFEGYCSFCEKHVDVTYSRGDIALDDRVVVHDVLRGTCDVCGTVVAIPPESTPAIQEALQRHPRRKSKTTVRIQPSLLSRVREEMTTAGCPSVSLDVVVRGFLMFALGSQANWKRAVHQLRVLRHPMLDDAPSSSLTLRLSPETWQLLDDFETETGLASSSELIRRIIALMAVDWGEVGNQGQRVRGPTADRPGQGEAAAIAAPIVSTVRNLALVS